MSPALAGLLYAAPALLLAALLLVRGRPYPGERIFATVVARARRRVRPRPGRALGRARHPDLAPPSGGRLLGARLAGRGPPRATAPA